MESARCLCLLRYFDKVFFYIKNNKSNDQKQQQQVRIYNKTQLYPDRKGRVEGDRTCSDFQQLQLPNSVTFTAIFSSTFCLHPIVCAAVATVYEHGYKLRILGLSFNDSFAKIFPHQFCKPKTNPK